VRRATEDENTSAAEIARLVALDPALSARLLRVANSALYRRGGAKPVDSLQVAIARLGHDTVRNLVAGLAMQQLFQSPSPALKARMQALWIHSTEVASLSSVLAARFTKLDREEALLAGLLHDIGALPILARAEDFPEFVAEAALLDETLARLHTRIGRLVLEAWGFAPELVAVAAEHEDLDRYTAEVDYTDVVIVANLHSHLGRPSHRHAGVSLADVPAVAKLGLNPAESLLVLEEARRETAELQAILQS
jgi:putative nucleotidyltransferase with HDIG domain